MKLNSHAIAVGFFICKIFKELASVTRFQEKSFDIKDQKLDFFTCSSSGLGSQST